jgi:hypothetical protein
MAVRALLFPLLLVAAAQAQNTNTNTQNTDTATQQNTDTATTKGTTAAQTKTTAQRTQTTQQTDTAQGTTTAAQQTITNVPTLSTGTDSGSDAPTTGVTDAPSLTTSVFHLTGVPTIAGYGIPTQVVPWTAGAPYQQTSRLPEGTVFIVVGAILGFMGLSILAWRGLVAWSLHRSVQRAAANALKSDSMVKLRDAKPSYTGGGLGNLPGSAHSLDRLSTAPTRLTKTSHGPTGTSAGAARNSSLFFSPTAGAGNHTSPTAALLSNSGANRSSAYLPAGYYAAPTASSPSPGPPGHTPSPLSSLSPLHRAGYRPQRDIGPSPPVSPGLPPSQYHDNSPSQLNMHVPGGALNGRRAPSANLEELFENHGNGPRERF